MEELKLIIEKGPRKGETLEYTPRSVIKIGRVVRGNTIAIKEDAGISSKHICIQFDNQLMKWTVIDLDSSNGTILNDQNLKPLVPSSLNDGDCIKIGEVTSMIVKFGVQSGSQLEQNPRRQVKSGAGVGVKSDMSQLGLGFDGDLGENAVVPKRCLRPRGKKDVDVKVEVESVNCKRNLRSSKQVLKGCSVPALNEIRGNSDVEEGKGVVVNEPKKRGRPKKLPAKPLEDPGLDGEKAMDIVVPAGGRGTRSAKNNLIVENVESMDAEDDGTVGEVNEAAFDEQIIDSFDNVDGGSSVNGSLDVDKGKGVVNEVEDKQDNDAGKETLRDNCRVWVLEKMTLGDFFDYLEEQMVKEIHEESEKIIADLEEKARRVNEFRRQMKGNGKR
ncbi:FHA domain-containing protein At4g14490-like [Rutidosis leptorrhynchoides]|uniref:FHA domain-containing protein At4g14490-like n=1 Tax=Rutidosis leptorrhynchoides TaxID=125765 RepID=UPI003A9A0A81